MSTGLTIAGVCAGLYFAFVGAYLSILMGRILRQNGRVLDKIDLTTNMLAEKIDSTTSMLAEKLDQGFKLIARLIVEENETTRKVILEALKR